LAKATNKTGALRFEAGFVFLVFGRALVRLIKSSNVNSWIEFIFLQIRTGGVGKTRASS
jgi:hypothetical protein